MNGIKALRTGMIPVPEAGQPPGARINISDNGQKLETGR
jgi:hypothetical protein